MARNRFLLTAAVVVALVAAACSNSSNADGTTTTAVESATSSTVSADGSDGSSTTAPSSGSTATTSTSTAGGSTTSTTFDGSGTPVTTMPHATDEEAMLHMCRTLALLRTAGATPPDAADSILFTDLPGASPTEIFNYGNVLTRAPRELCPELIQYGFEVSYWLGI